MSTAGDPTEYDTRSLEAIADADFFLGTVIDDAAYTDTTVLVNLNARPMPNLSRSNDKAKK